MKRVCWIIAFFLLAFLNIQAQPYNIGIGARLGKLNNGITFKKFVRSDPNIAFEAQLFQSLIAATYGYTVKGLLLDQINFHIPYVQLPLDFIIGGGVQAGYFPYKPPEVGYYKIVNGGSVPYYKDVFTTGIALNIGLEYQLSKRVAPASIGIDVVPSYDFINPGPDWFDFGVDIRYIIR